ncbi:MAG: Flp family type IVb pilin [Nocardioidaceae bacterium]
MNVVRHPKQSESGASAVEYGLLVALIASAVILATFALGQVVKKGFGDTCATIEASQGSASGQSQAKSSGKKNKKDKKNKKKSSITSLCAS